MCKFDISIDGEVGENYFQFPLQNKACTSMYVRNLQHFKLEKKKWVERLWVGGGGAAGRVHHA